MIRLDKADRSRQSSIWVDGKEYLIHTAFHYWINFDKKAQSIKDFSELDGFYKPVSDDGTWHGIPENKKAAFEELKKFYLNEQPLPRDTGKKNKKVVDFFIDSERIRCAFLERYRIDIITTDLHWHDFLVLLQNLNWNYYDVIGKRQYEKPTKKTQKQIEAETEAESLQYRYMWELETEKKEKFKMK
jgi:hypothetical protein